MRGNGRQHGQVFTPVLGVDRETLAKLAEPPDDLRTIGVRRHHDSLSEMDAEGEALDTYRRTNPNRLGPGQDLTTIFHGPHWRH